MEEMQTTLVSAFENCFEIISQKCSLLFCNSKNICTFVSQNKSICPDGGIGRRVGLKHQWINFLAGSIPALGTIKLKS